MTAREEVARLLAEHWMASGRSDCRCGARVDLGAGIAPHLAQVLDDAGLIGECGRVHDGDAAWDE